MAVEWGKYGATKPAQDPNEGETAKYKDDANSLPDDKRLTPSFLPSVPEPKPFKG